MSTAILKTDFEEDICKSAVPYSEYPRPQFKRNSFLNLNGLWDFKIENKGQTTYNGKILVPFLPESRISGVEREILKDDILIYSRKFVLDPLFVKNSILLHIDACDQYAAVFINGKPVGENVGGYLPINMDITDFIHVGENEITVRARDPMNLELPYGKQTNQRGGMWYTKISGIWQTVWLESLPKNPIEKLKITPDLKGVDICVIGGINEKTLIFQGREYHFAGDRFRLEVENPILWTPETPQLYDLTVLSGEDEVETYFALRTVSVKTVKDKQLLCLNDKPYFFNGVLDQGYFSDGIFLPATVEGFINDIRKMKACGFNMLRKHIKLEPDLFYYYCDKSGIFVFQDFINSGKYSFLLDTALPTVGIKCSPDRKVSPFRREQFTKTCQGIIDLLYNHPSVVYYTIFNEGWGQFDADGFYEKFRNIDSTRIYDSTSGWFKKKKSDVESLHVYFKPVKLKKKYKKPAVLSEFGGYSFKVEGHSFNLKDNYGYKTFKTAHELQKGIEELYLDELLPAIDLGLSAAVLTQLSDVEDETNGILTYDRKVTKLDIKKMAAINHRLYDRFTTNFGE